MTEFLESSGLISGENKITVNCIKDLEETTTINNICYNVTVVA